METSNQEFKLIKDQSDIPILGISVENVEKNMSLHGNGTELIRLCENGDILVKGKLVDNDKEAVDGLREFLMNNIKQ